MTDTSEFTRREVLKIGRCGRGDGAVGGACVRSGNRFAGDCRRDA